jgi:hypothetical protein
MTQALCSLEPSKKNQNKNNQTGVSLTPLSTMDFNYNYQISRPPQGRVRDIQIKQYYLLLQKSIMHEL